MSNSGSRTADRRSPVFDAPLVVVGIGGTTREISWSERALVATPRYHGELSGHLKNTLDYLEDLSEADRPYLDGRRTITCASRERAAVMALAALGSIVHALRGWPARSGYRS